MSSQRARRALVGAALALALSATSALSSAGAAEVPDHPLIGSITGEKVGENEQFKDACGVAVDSAGEIYVADYYQNRIIVLNKKEEYLTQIDNINPITDGGAAPIDGPCDLAVDSAGHLYVNDYHRDVVRFTPSEFPLAPPTGMPAKSSTTYSAATVIDSAHSTGVAVDPETDDVYIDDRTYIAAYEPSGAPVMDEGKPLRIGENSLENAYSVAISRYPGTDGLIYVPDAASETIKVYDPALDLENPQSQIAGEGTEQGHFDLADTDLAVDPADGHLYVSQNLQPHFEERPEEIVDEFSPAGYYRGPVPRSFANGTLSFLQAGEPSGLAIAKGDLYVSSGNFENAAVFIFGPPAAVTTQLLSVSKTGAGEGTIASVPAGIGCGTVCVGEFSQGTNVVLKATAAPGSVLIGWSGCDEVPSPGRCAVKMSADRSVSAQFEAAPAEALALNARPQGTLAPAAPSLLSAAGARAPKPQRHRAHRHRHAHPRRGAKR